LKTIVVTFKRRNLGFKKGKGISVHACMIRDSLNDVNRQYHQTGLSFDISHDPIRLRMKRLKMANHELNPNP